MVEASIYAMFLAAAVVYAAPSLIAVWRGREHWLRIVVVNVLFGWTGVGWLAALAMASRIRIHIPLPRPRPRRPRASAPRPASSVAASDPPPILEDVYGGWLDRGEAMVAGPSAADRASARTTLPRAMPLSVVAAHGHVPHRGNDA